ncbi:MAG TPA: acyl carrier protein [Chloroflexi bacterium]|jgi:acyl carrier protein|nr:acyl carrier protein [Chloroflexota bacterium]
MNHSVEESIRTYIAQNILFRNDGYPYEDSTSFLDNGIVDSINVMELVMFVEETFGIKVKDEEIVPDHFDSVERLSAYVRQKGE